MADNPSFNERIIPMDDHQLNVGIKTKTNSKHIFSILQGIFPILRWGRKYTASKFKSDFFAGLTLASLSIPQSIGYANLAKLDPQYGLYTNVVPPLIYAAMGSSREIAIGPVAVVSLLLSAMIQKIIDPSIDPIGYRNLVFTVHFLLECFKLHLDYSGTYTNLNLCRLGFLVGFSCEFFISCCNCGIHGGAAIVIGLQQLKGLLGLSNFTNKPMSCPLSELFGNHGILTVFVLGCSFLIFLLSTRFLITRGDRHGIKIVKHIKRGINPISIQQLSFNGPNVGDAAKIGLIAAVVALDYFYCCRSNRSFVSVKGYHLDGNKEMVAMDFMNIAGSCTSCYLATSKICKQTAVNFSAGCETVVSNIVMALTVILALECLTRLLYFTPIAILASVILSALPVLIDVHEAYNIWKIDKFDFLACIGAFFGVIFCSVEIGLLAVVTISILKIILSAIRPGIEVFGRFLRSDIFGSINQYKMFLPTPGVLVIRIDTALLCMSCILWTKNRKIIILICFIKSVLCCFRIMRWVLDDDEEEEEEEASKTKEEKMIRVLILDISNLLNIDIFGIIALEELKKKLSSLGIQVALANPGWQVINKLKLAKFVDKTGEESVFLTVGEAMHACLESKTANVNTC
ncbi:hypothetical protein MKX01_037095 [Papaver californicum]|nr:hypothetical protein MKX01_037095 [Papaver californicum]